MSKKILWIMTIMSALTFNQLTFAEPAICRAGIDKMVQELNLTDDQKAKAKPVIAQLKSDLQAAGSQMGNIESQISAQATSANMDQDKVNGLIDNKAKLIGDMMKAKVKAKNQIFAILTADQKTKLQSLVTKEDNKMAALYTNCDRD